MTTGQRALIVALFIAAVASSVLPARAQSGGEMVRQLQLQLRQSEQERHTLRAEAARLQAQIGERDAELTQLRRELAQVKGRQSAAASALDARANLLEQTTTELEASRGELTELRAQNERQAQALANVRGLLEGSEQRLTLRNELIDLCRQRNQQLYEIGNQILTHYASADWGDVLARREPFLRLKRVELENALQTFEDRLREQRVYENTLPPSVERRMQQSMKQEPR